MSASRSPPNGANCAGACVIMTSFVSARYRMGSTPDAVSTSSSLFPLQRASCSISAQIEATVA